MEEFSWLSKIVNTTSDAVIVIDRDRTIVFANDAAPAIAGFPSKADIVGKRYDAILQESRIFEEDGAPADPSQFPSVQAFLQNKAISGKLYKRIFQGQHAWMRISATPINGAGGGPEHCIIRFADISSDKWKRDRLEFLMRSEHSLSLTADYRQLLIDKARLTVPDLADWCTVNIIDPDGMLSRIIVTHRDPSKEHLVRRLAELSVEELGEAAGVLHVIATGEPLFVSHVEDTFISAQGPISSERYELVKTLQVCSSMTLPIVSRGSLLGVLSIAYAESGRQYTEEDLRFMQEYCHHLGITVDNARLYEEIRAKDRLKDDFLAALSHELRNPLAPIKSSLELLAMTDALPEHREELNIVQQQFQHLTGILNELLDVTRYARGKIKLEKQVFDLSDMLRGIAGTYAPLMREREITFHAAIPEGPLPLYADPVRLRQAVMNLIDNANKFTPPGGSIWIEAEQQDTSVSICVRDTGLGIPSNEVGKIFELHFQASNNLHNAHSGLGIGLVLVKNIIDLHDGRVEAMSEGPGGGSEFRISLPCTAFPTV